MIDPMDFVRQKEKEAASCDHPKDNLCGIWPRGTVAPFYRCNKCDGFVRKLTPEEIEKATNP